MDNKLKQRVLWLMGVCFVILACVACDDDPSPQPNNLLAGTKWKFLGLYDVVADTLREIEVCEDDFIVLKFLNNSDMTIGLIDAEMIRCSYAIDVDNSIFKLYWDALAEVVECIEPSGMQDLTDALHSVSDGKDNIGNFECKDGILKIYYEDNKQYMLYEAMK